MIEEVKMAWNNKVAVITGGASGIGQALARQLIQHGCHLALVDVNPDALATTQEQLCTANSAINISTHAVDVTDKAQMQALPEAVMAEHGRVDILFNNAGICIDKSFDNHSIEDWELIVNINFWGVIYGSKFFMPYLKQQPEAFIINTSSLAGFLGIPTQASYCATKAAVRSMSESLYAEYKSQNIHVLSVHPGAIKTNLFKRTIELSDDPESSKKMFDFVEKTAMDADKAAQKIIKAAMKKKQRTIIGMDARLVEISKRLLPSIIHHFFDWGYRLKMKKKNGS